MSPILLRLRMAVLLVTAVCAAEASAGGTIRVVNQAQIPVASLRIGFSERLTDKPVLPGRSFDVAVAAGSVRVGIGLGFLSGGVRDIVLAGVPPSGLVTVREGETVRLVVARLRGEQVLARGIGAGDPAFPAQPSWTAAYRAADGVPQSFSLTFSPSGEWSMRGPKGVVRGKVTEVSWPDQSTSFTFRLNSTQSGRLDRPYTNFFLPHVELDRPLLQYFFSPGFAGPGWQ